MGLFDKIKNMFAGKTTEEQPAEANHSTAEQENRTEHLFSKYNSLTCTQIGMRHTQKNLPCCVQASSVDREDLHLLILSDGMTAESMRGAKGAALASVAAKEAMFDFAAKTDPAALSEERARYQSLLLLGKDILLRWNQAVKEDMAAQNHESDETPVDSSAYAADLLAFLVTPQYTIALRNGHSSCVLIDTEGKTETVFSMEGKREKREALSLHDKTAIMNFDFYFSEKMPAAVLAQNGSASRYYGKAEDLYAMCCRLCVDAAEGGMEHTASTMREAAVTFSEKKTSDDLAIAVLINDSYAKQNKEELTGYLEQYKTMRLADETRRQLARVTKNLKEKQNALETAQNRVAANKAEVEDLQDAPWALPGLELSEEELSGLYDGLQACEEKIECLKKDIEALQTEKNTLSEKLTGLTEKLHI